MNTASAGPDRSPPAIEIDGLTKSYGRAKALDEVSFTVERGGVTALLGLNGAGKTTLFQIITGLFAADRGTVRVAGRDFNQDPVAALRRMGLVFQQQVLDLDLTLDHNLRFYAGLHGLRGSLAARAIAAALDRLGISDLGPRKVRELSGGTRRKLEIARALITAPEVLLLDEPSTGLDTGSRRDLAATLFGLATERNIAIFWATHLVHEVEDAARVVILHQGRVAAAGRPADLIAQTRRPTLEAAFLSIVGASPDERAAT